MIESWLALVRVEGSAVEGSDAEGRAAGEDLIARYAEPHRRYHDVRHLREVLEGVDALAAEAQDPDAVRLAAWFHDAVYTVDAHGSGTADAAPAVSNEEASALLAESVLSGLGLPSARVEEVARLVRLTESHAPSPGDRNAEVLCDADLAVLGASPERYAEYVAEVREEYSAVPDEVFRPARAAILRALTNAPTLYRTAAARARLEARARANLARELEALTDR